MAAFSFFSHFLDDRTICLDTILRLINSSSKDTLLPMMEKRMEITESESGKVIL